MATFPPLRLLLPRKTDWLLALVTVPPFAAVLVRLFLP